MTCTHICLVLHLVDHSYSLCGFFLLSKNLFMLVRKNHLLEEIAIGPGRQSIIAPGLPVGEAENQRSQQFVKSRQQNKKKKCLKEGEREVSGRAKAAAAAPDKPCGLYLLLKFCSVRKCIVTSLKSTAIYKLTLLRKPVL